MGDGDVTVLIGAVHAHAGRRQSVNQHPVGMPVVVARTDRDHRNPGMRRGQEGGLLIGAAMVRDLQNVRADVSAATLQVTLRLDLDVARGQQGDLIHGDPRDERGVVGIRTGPHVAGHRREHLDHRRPDEPGLSRGEGDDCHTGISGGRAQPVVDI